MSIAQLVKAFFLPGSPELLLLALVGGVGLLYVPALARWGRRWLTVFALGYVVMSLPQCAGWLLDLAVGTPPHVQDASDAAGVRTVVLLGNGAVSADDGERSLNMPSVETAYNVLEAVRLYRVLGAPRIIASGGGAPGSTHTRSEAATMRDLLIDLGVSPDAIVLERDSRTTYEQAVNVARMVDRSQPIVLVTVPRHMPRSRALFEAQGLRVIPSASMHDRQRRAWFWRWWLPSRHAMRVSEMLVYERLARVNGWLTGQYERAEAPAAVVAR
ncbi:MAG TPA: YdcF family protein [Vicinamibacterales bacterium]